MSVVDDAVEGRSRQAVLNRAIALSEPATRLQAARAEEARAREAFNTASIEERVAAGLGNAYSRSTDERETAERIVLEAVDSLIRAVATWKQDGERAASNTAAEYRHLYFKND